MLKIKADHILDAKGLSCPMPIVKTKKALNELNPGQVIEVQATDKGSTVDIQAWANSAGEQYLGTIKTGDVLKHYLRKSDPGEEKNPAKHPYVNSLQDLQEKIDDKESMTILDVREAAEYAFGHIPGAKSIPLGDLEERMAELNADDHIYVICRTGNRSDFAAQKLSKKGFKHVFNIVPGMTEWNGPTEKIY